MAFDGVWVAGTAGRSKGGYPREEKPFVGNGLRPKLRVLAGLSRSAQ